MMPLPTSSTSTGWHAGEGGDGDTAAGSRASGGPADSLWRESGFPPWRGGDVIRSIVGNQADHDAVQVFNGRDPRRPKLSGGWPQFGTILSKLEGAARLESPPFVSLCYQCTHGPSNEPGPGFLGMAHSPLRPLGDSRRDLVLNGVTLDRLADRTTLMRSLDSLRRDIDTTGMMAGYDAFTEQAMGLLTSSRVAEALDLSREDPRIVERRRSVPSWAAITGRRSAVPSCSEAAFG
jgi:hypothetical protein